MTNKSWQNGSGTEMIYSSSTLHVEVKKAQMNGHPYWAARVRTSSPKQLRSALSYGTYGGARENTTSAVPRNGGIIGVNGSALTMPPEFLHLWECASKMGRFMETI